jgi:hypothetical protein
MPKPGAFRPFSKKKWQPRDDTQAPHHMSKLTSGAWDRLTTLTDKQKKRVHVNGR